MAIDHEFDDSNSVIHDTGRGFLGHLTPDVVPSYAFRGRQQFLRDYNHALRTIWDKSEWFILTGVDQQIFATVFGEAESGPCSCWSSYDAELNLLLVKMIHSPHSVAARTFNMKIIDALEPIGMKSSLYQIGDATHVSKIGSKQPDEAWRPRRIPRAQSRTWPSAVLEVALSETRAKLQRDIRFWHRAPEGRVKVILTLHINRNRPEITIEQWETGGSNRCERTQRIVVSKRRRGTTFVAGGPLIIGFAKLFLRQPDLSREQDISLGDEELEFVANAVWDLQGFLNHSK